MFTLVTYNAKQIEALFAGTLQGMDSCDRCGDDLEIHERLVVEFNLKTNDPEARHWLDPREGTASPADGGAVVNGYTVVGCDRQARVWRLWAARKANPVSGREFMNFGSEQTVRRCFATAGEPTEVKLTEDPEGTHWGWIDCDREQGHKGAPVMIQPHEGWFRIQEPSGFRDRVAQGRGEIVRMTVKAVA